MTDYRELLRLDNALIVNVGELTPGYWILKVSSAGAHTIRVTGRSNLDFSHGFSRSPTDTMDEALRRPINGDNDNDHILFPVWFL